MANQTVAELMARIAELETAANKKNKLGCKISDKGGLSVYGLGRFPVTLYDEQWTRLIAFIPELQVELDKARAAGKLSKKGDPKPAADAGTRVDVTTGDTVVDIETAAKLLQAAMAAAK